jgi:ATP-dependent Lhr-like helicase
MAHPALDPFHPTVRDWFDATFGEPSAPQCLGWPRIAAGEHTLIAAPTGSGKTLAAFLFALDRLLREDDGGRDRTSVLYVSPLKALGNDVQRNLLAPLAALRERDPSLPELRVAVRSGDTPQRERLAMRREPPQVLVTTPESLHVLLAGESGRTLLAGVRTVIVDEIHAIADDKRGSHLALALELLATTAGEFQRIGLSATQRPIERVAEFLVGAGRHCAVVDVGHLRELDLRIEVPGLPLAAVASEDHSHQVADRIAALVAAHRTTIVFANTRKVAERMARRLTERLGDGSVTSHHGSLSREHRLLAEKRLKAGELRAIVATASLELGIDVGDVDLVVQIGATASIAQALQRVGRAGHGKGRVPKGRVFPLTLDELLTAAGLSLALRRGELDELEIPRAPLDILAQLLVVAALIRSWPVDELFALVRRALPYRELSREDFDAVLALHAARGRFALLHVDPVERSVRATKRAALIAVTSGGAIPDRAEYEVVAEPEGARVGTVEEDFAIEATVGDVFQLGNVSWRIVGTRRGQLRVVDAQGAPPSMPFWFGEAPARTPALSASLDEVRERGIDPAWLRSECGRAAAPALPLAEFLAAGRAALGTTPTRGRLVLERFFDEGGGTQLVLHAPFGSRINRALGLALRKRFCRGFGFELQAAANDDAILLSLGPMHAFPLEDVFEYLHPRTARDLLVQALLAAPMFQTRWRWNVARALIVPRAGAGRRVPAILMRMRADDELAAAFPQVMACGENLPPGDLPVPLDHPLVRQTIEDCLREAMDVDGFLALVRGLRDGSLERVAVERGTASPFAHAILAARPYMFLDDAPLEERRAAAVRTRARVDPTRADVLGAPDPRVVEELREDVWPHPTCAPELAEALGWLGFCTEDEARRSGWLEWLSSLATRGNVVHEGERWYAITASRDPKELWRGRLEALGPVVAPMDDPALLALEAEGLAMRVVLDGIPHWCHRRLLARLHRETLERLRARVAPVSVADFMRFVRRWQHAEVGAQLEVPAGIVQIVTQLSGIDAPAARWEDLLRSRLAKYRAHWLDQLTLSGEIVALRLWGRGSGPVKLAPLALVPRAHLAGWLAWRETDVAAEPSADARTLLAVLERCGASFPDECCRQSGLLPSRFEDALAELLTHGLVSVDSFAAVRALCVAPSKRGKDALAFGVGRIARVPAVSSPRDVEFVLDRLLARWGVLLHRLLLRERVPVTWRELLRAARLRELRGTLLGGRFVAGVFGEQFALPEAVPLLRDARERVDAEAEAPPRHDPLWLDAAFATVPRALT